MDAKKIVDTFNDAMSDIRFGYWTHNGSNGERKILAEGIMKMESLMDPLWEILKKKMESEA